MNNRNPLLIEDGDLAETDRCCVEIVKDGKNLSKKLVSCEKRMKAFVCEYRLGLGTGITITKIA